MVLPSTQEVEKYKLLHKFKHQTKLLHMLKGNQHQEKHALSVGRQFKLVMLPMLIIVLNHLVIKFANSLVHAVGS